MVGTVFGQMIGDSCAYICIDDFSASTGTEFRNTVDSMRSQGATKVFALDLRNNPGSNLSSALIAADYCCLRPHGPGTVQGRHGGGSARLR